MKSTLKLLNLVVAASAMFVISSCSGEATENGAPVQLVVTHSENLARLDLAGGTRCEETLGTFNFRTILKNPALTGQFAEVRITRYRVSYVRTDGGTAVPASHVTPVNFIVGQTGTVDDGEQVFRTLRSDAFVQAPFVALLPNNGGRDPETGRTNIRMDVIVEFFGETLGGDNVYAVSRHQLEFCYSCNGCS
jgi:hypothetical protein